jgi:hypothetical protein
MRHILSAFARPFTLPTRPPRDQSFPSHPNDTAHDSLHSQKLPHVLIVSLFDAMQASSCRLYTPTSRTHSYTPALLSRLSDAPVPQQFTNNLLFLSLARFLCRSRILLTHTHPLPTRTAQDPPFPNIRVKVRVVFSPNAIYQISRRISKFISRAHAHTQRDTCPFSTVVQNLPSPQI